LACLTCLTRYAIIEYNSNDMNINVSKLTKAVLSQLEAKQRDVLENRYGLSDGAVKTLAEIGEKYHITRERVRQIESVAIKEVLKNKDSVEMADFVSLVKNHLKNVGGVRRDVLLLSDLKLMIADPNSPHLGNKVRFLLETAGEPRLVSEDNNFYAYWHLGEDEKRKAQDFSNKLVKLMDKQRGTVVSHQNIDSVLSEATKPHNFKDLVALNYVSLSKQFHINHYGDFGLASWPEVNPKNMKDWAYSVLKKQNKPLHFGEITKFINKVCDNKIAHPQTVHNELIKDERFVLVGRGTYGLKEFGIMPGTAKEVLANLIKQHGPLSPKELISLVLKERVFKKNTILINLQNRKHFKRLEDGKYATLV